MKSFSPASPQTWVLLVSILAAVGIVASVAGGVANVPWLQTVGVILGVPILLCGVVVSLLGIVIVVANRRNRVSHTCDAEGDASCCNREQRVVANIRTILEDDWQSGNNIPHESPYESVGDACSRVRGLNGENRTIVALHVDDGTYLTIVGGREERYVCSITRGGQCSYLVNPQATTGNRLEVTGHGRGGSFESRFCCSIGDVLAAVEYFAVSQKPNPDQSWEAV